MVIFQFRIFVTQFLLIKLVFFVALNGNLDIKGTPKKKKEFWTKFLNKTLYDQNLRKLIETKIDLVKFLHLKDFDCLNKSENFSFFEARVLAYLIF